MALVVIAESICELPPFDIQIGFHMSDNTAKSDEPGKSLRV